jgi:N-acetyl-beta-hexosaminidase
MASPQAMQFASNIFSSVASTFPSKYISTGGDEVNTGCFSNDNETQNILRSTGQTIEQVLNSFTQATHGALRNAGKTPIVWEEMVLDHTVTLSNDTIAMLVCNTVFIFITFTNSSLGCGYHLRMWPVWLRKVSVLFMLPQIFFTL